MRRVERERRWENLWLPVTVDWSFRANRFELAGGQDLALLPDWRNLIAYSDWLLLTDRCVVNTVYDKDDRCVVTGCLLIDSRDTYASMIMRFARFSLTASFSLVSSLRGERKPLRSGYQSSQNKNQSLQAFTYSPFLQLLAPEPLEKLVSWCSREIVLK